MNGRSRLLLAFVVFVLLGGVVLGGPAIAAAGSTKGSGGWYWPTGTENFGGMDGYWVHRPANHSWHMAQDMASPQGHPVYAIADGVVAESKADAGYGGVLVIWHKTGNGQKFLAVYGHIIRKNLGKGAKVKADQVIGTVNSANHCHFGIHPGDKYPPDGNPFRGHTYIESETYGWVDPVIFLRTHPAYQLPYSAPALPLVATVSTLSSPTVLGFAGGSEYWSTVSGDDSTTVCARCLRSGETTRLAEDATLPKLDKTRFLATTATASFKLYDRLPVLTAAYSTVKPAWNHPITIAGSLKSAARKPFSGAKVYLQRSNGKTWVTVANTTTDLQGVYSLDFVPTRSFTLRVKFTPPSTFVSACSVKVAVAPKPGLHAPDSAKQAKSGRSVTLSGKLDARHPAGGRSVTLRLQLLGPTGWTDVLTTWATNANAGTGTRYSRTITLPAGSWRVSASCKADSLYAAEVTGWVGFKVK